MTSNPLETILANSGDPIYAANWNRIVRSLRRQYNVQEYGATGDGVTDDTQAFQLAINACVAGGGGAVFIPFPAVRYLLAGAIHPTWRCQIFIPHSDQVEGMTHVHIIGEERPNLNVSEGFMATPDPLTGCLLYSSATAAQPGDAVFGCAYTNAPIYGNMNFTNLSVTNLHLVVKSKDAQGNHIPVTMTGIDGFNLSSLFVEWSRVRMESETFYSVQPAAGSHGIRWPHFNNKFSHTCNHVLINGFETGFQICEHFNATRIAALGCVNAVKITGPEPQHPASIMHLNVESCIHAFLHEGGSPLHVMTYQVERLDKPGRWNNFVSDLKSTGGQSKIVVQAAAATRTGVALETSYTANDPSRLIIRDVLNAAGAPTVTAG